MLCTIPGSVHTWVANPAGRLRHLPTAKGVYRQEPTISCGRWGTLANCVRGWFEQPSPAIHARHHFWSLECLVLAVWNEIYSYNIGGCVAARGTATSLGRTNGRANIQRYASPLWNGPNLVHLTSSHEYMRRFQSKAGEALSLPLRVFGASLLATT
jgi:hypothetical protein